MGNCNCCGEKDERAEFSVSDTIDVEHKKRKQPSSKASLYSDEHMNKHVHKIIKIQALWRGMQARKLSHYLRVNNRGGSKYFTIDESRETLSKRRYDPSLPREKRPLYKFKTGATYLGEWRGGFRDGFGEQVWPDGARYTGEWRDNRAHGRGKFVHVDGDVYEGEWVNDKANGYGEYKHVNGALYQGRWKDDLQHGKGKEVWTDGSTYEGMYLKGKKHGYGAYRWNDGSRYDGQWFENKISGIGVYAWLDGRTYKGQWKNNNMHGHGIYFWKDGRKYEGEYEEDKKHGFGVYTWADGRRYEGYWANGKQHGLGRYLVPNEDREKYGLWEDGKRIEWFEQEVVRGINERVVNYTEFFAQPESAELVQRLATFSKPKGFDKQIHAVTLELERAGQEAAVETGYPTLYH